MAVYKVIQDIESEDKLLGPLTLKGFIYAALAGLLIFIDIRLAISGASALIKLIFIVLFLPPTALFAVLASPLGREQPTEVWLLSHIRFLLKPKMRRWDQLGAKNLVTITVPKKVERILTKNLSQTEVMSRLQALANTLDSRGWAVKNAAINLNDQPTYSAADESDDRLSGATTLVEPAPVLDVHPADDILDEQNNPTAQSVQEAMNKAEEARKAAVQKQLDVARRAAELEAAADATDKQQAATIESKPADSLTEDEKELLDRIHQRDAELRAHPPIITAGATTTPVTEADQTVKLHLSQSGNDLSVATIARLVNRSSAGAAEGII